MKSFFLILVSGLLINSLINKPVLSQVVGPSACIDRNNPTEAATNFDPNWRWEDANINRVWYSLQGETPSFLDVATPFYTNGHTLADAQTNDLKDMWREDGWMLAYKDFGTSMRAPAKPFFILYNKYKGMLRVMVYNNTGVSASAFRMTISFRGSSPKSGLLSFPEKRSGKQYRDAFDGALNQTVLTSATPNRDWIYGDFLLTNYIRDLSDLSVLHIDVNSVDLSDLGITGTLSLDEILKSSSGGTSTGFSAGDFKNGLDKGFKVYKDVLTAQKDLRKKDPDLDIPGTVVGLISNALSGNIFSLIDFIVGGATKPVGREPMSFKGSTTLTGTITTDRAYTHFDLALRNNGSIGCEVYKPVQDIPWGVVSVLRVNIGDPVATSQTYYCADKGYDVTDNGSYTNFRSLDFDLNDGIGVRLVSTEFAVFGNVGTDLKPIDQLPNAPYAFEGQDACYGTSSVGSAQSIGIKFNFEILSPVKSYDKFYSVYKIYNFYDSGARKAAPGSVKPVAESVNVYPNPFTDGVRIGLTNNTDNVVSLQLVDVTGRLLMNVTPTATDKQQGFVEWDGKDSFGKAVPQGMYFVKYESKGERIQSQKIIKQ